MRGRSFEQRVVLVLSQNEPGRGWKTVSSVTDLRLLCSPAAFFRSKFYWIKLGHEVPPHQAALLAVEEWDRGAMLPTSASMPPRGQIHPGGVLKYLCHTIARVKTVFPSCHSTLTVFWIAPQTTDSALFLQATDRTTDAVKFQSAGGLAKDIRAFYECLLSFHRGERGMVGGERESTVRWEELWIC